MKACPSTAQTLKGAHTDRPGIAQAHPRTPAPGGAAAAAAAGPPRGRGGVARAAASQGVAASYGATGGVAAEPRDGRIFRAV